MTTPPLKWAGGKRWLVAAGHLPIPFRFERYVEPFLGSAAVYFHLMPQNAFLSDLNAELIRFYTVLRDKPIELYELMKRHQRNHSSTHYYRVRAQTPATDLRAAAKFLYLNRTCWNGLYRVNLKGEFNVPKGTKERVLLDTDDFVAYASILKNAVIDCLDFEQNVERCIEGDFLFLDPPYTVQHNFNGFLKYNEKIFNWSDQIRLRNAVVRAVDRGVAIALTNADHPSIRKLYQGTGKYIRVQRASVLAGSAANRGITSEALFLFNVTEIHEP